MATKAYIAAFYFLNIVHPKMVNIINDPVWENLPHSTFLMKMEKTLIENCPA